MCRQSDDLTCSLMARPSPDRHVRDPNDDAAPDRCPVLLAGRQPGPTRVRRSILHIAAALTCVVHSVLIHPNTGDVVRDHTELATWMGNRWPLNLDPLRR